MSTAYSDYLSGPMWWIKRNKEDLWNLYVEQIPGLLLSAEKRSKMQNSAYDTLSFVKKMGGRK